MGEFICPQCGQRDVVTIQYDHACEWADDCVCLGLSEDEPIVVYHCEYCEEDLLIQKLRK
ncbi:MAG: hypothetical protein QXP36_02155 [Conexivisphaerales archaeon]